MLLYFLLITSCLASDTYRNNQGVDIDWYFSKPPQFEGQSEADACGLGQYNRFGTCTDVLDKHYTIGFNDYRRCPRNTYGGHGGIWSCKPCPYGGNDIAVNTIEECSIRNYNADSTFYERVNKLVEPNGHLYPGDDCYYNTDETLLERIGKLYVEAFEELDDGPCESYPMEIKERFMDVLERTGLKAIIALMGGPFTINNLISLILHIAMYCLTNLDALCVPEGFLDFFYRTFGKVVESIADRDLFLREMETTGKVIEEKLFHGYIDPAICLSLNSRRRLMRLKQQAYKLNSNYGCSTTCEQKGTLVPTEGICSQPNIGQVCSGAIVSQHYDIETGGYFDADDCGFYNGICLLNIEDYSDSEKPYLGRRNTGFRGTCACPEDKIHIPDNPDEPCIDKCQGEQIGVYYMNINGKRDYTCINKCQMDYSLKLPYSCNIDMLSRPHMLCNTEEVENIDCCAAFNEPIYYRNGDKVESECRDKLGSSKYYKTPGNCKLDRNSKFESLCTIEELQNIVVKDSCDPNPCSHNRRCEPGIFFDKFHNKHTYRCHCSEYENGNFISGSIYEVDWFDETKPVNWNCALPSIDYCADNDHFKYFTKITIGDKSICTTEAFAFNLAEKNTNCTKTRDNSNIWLKTLHCPENTIIYEKYQDPCNPNPCSDGSKCWNKDVVEDYSTGRGYECDCTDWDKYSMSADRPGMKVNDKNFYFSICQLYKNGCYYSSHPEIFDHTNFYFGRGYPGYTHEEYKDLFGCRYGDCAIYDYNYCVGDGSTNICAEKYGIDLMTFNNIERRGWVRESLTHSPRDGFQCIYRCPPGKGINGRYPNSLNFDRGITEFFRYTYDESIHYGEIIRDTSNICKECIQGYYSKSELNVDLCIECPPGTWQYENGKDYCNSPCNPNPCQNNGTCTWEWNDATNDYVKHTDQYGNEHNFVCECPKKYNEYVFSGVLCDQIDSNPCKKDVNGAQFSYTEHAADEDGYTFTCNCDDGYTGVECDGPCNEHAQECAIAKFYNTDLGHYVQTRFECFNVYKQTSQGAYVLKDGKKQLDWMCGCNIVQDKWTFDDRYVIPNNIKQDFRYDNDGNWIGNTFDHIPTFSSDQSDGLHNAIEKRDYYQYKGQKCDVRICLGKQYWDSITQSCRPLCSEGEYPVPTNLKFNAGATECSSCLYLKEEYRHLSCCGSTTSVCTEIKDLFDSYCYAESCDMFKLCDAGYEKSNGVCQACPYGTYSYGALCRPWTECDPGEKLTGFSATSDGTCTECPQGKFSISKLVEIEGQDISTRIYECTDCPSGKHQNIAGKTSCKDCPSGRYTLFTGESFCSGCRPGTYQDQNGQSSCKACVPPYYYNDYSATSCKFCGSNKVVETNKWGRGVDCKECPAGTKQIGSSCSSCEKGQYQDDTGQSYCKDCPTGKYSNQEGSTSCINCQSGQYQDNTGQSYCKDCPTNKYSNQEGSTSCINCQSGYYQNVEGSTACIPCASLNDDCEECPPGTKTIGLSCSSCEKGQYQDNAGQSYCKDCPTGKYINQEGSTSCINCQSGYYPNLEL